MLKVYLAGEIHTNWREEIIDNCKKQNFKIEFSSPVTDHPSSDDCGVEILGPEENNFWKDRKGANINSIRTKKSINDCDVIIVKFGEKYKENPIKQIITNPTNILKYPFKIRSSNSVILC